VVVQLIYLQKQSKQYINAIFGHTETLLYPGVEKLITSIDLLSPTPTFTYVQKSSFLSDLQITEDQFLDTGILVGCEHSLPFPPIAHEGRLRATVDMVKYYKSGHQAVSAFAEQPQVKGMFYLDHFARTRSMVKFSLVLTMEGVVQPLPLVIAPPPLLHHQQQHNSNNSNNNSNNNHPHHHPTAADIPSDLADIFTARLSDEVYFYLSRGLIGPQPLVWLTTGQIIEPPPLDNGETEEYQRFVKEVITDGQTGPRATAIALISNVFHSHWNERRITGCFWFDQINNNNNGNPNNAKSILHNSAQTAQLTERVAGWLVPSPIIEDELRRQNVGGLLLLAWGLR